MKYKIRLWYAEKDPEMNNLPFVLSRRSSLVPIENRRHRTYENKLYLLATRNGVSDSFEHKVENRFV